MKLRIVFKNILGGVYESKVTLTKNNDMIDVKIKNHYISPEYEKKEITSTTFKLKDVNVTSKLIFDLINSEVKTLSSIDSWKLMEVHSVVLDAIVNYITDQQVNYKRHVIDDRQYLEIYTIPQRR